MIPGSNALFSLSYLVYFGELCFPCYTGFSWFTLCTKNLIYIVDYGTLVDEKKPNKLFSITA